MDHILIIIVLGHDSRSQIPRCAYSQQYDTDHRGCRILKVRSMSTGIVRECFIEEVELEVGCEWLFWGFTNGIFANA